MASPNRNWKSRELKVGRRFRLYKGPQSILVTYIPQPTPNFSLRIALSNHIHGSQDIW